MLVLELLSVLRINSAVVKLNCPYFLSELTHVVLVHVSEAVVNVERYKVVQYVPSIFGDF